MSHLENEYFISTPSESNGIDCVRAQKEYAGIERKRNKQEGEKKEPETNSGSIVGLLL